MALKDTACKHNVDTLSIYLNIIKKGLLHSKKKTTLQFKIKCTCRMKQQCFILSGLVVRPLLQLREVRDKPQNKNKNKQLEESVL